MKRKSRVFLAGGSLVISGIAIACAMKAMPYLGLIEVSAWNIAVAGAQGYQNPARAAAMKKLDEKAVELLGEAEWRSNNYLGPVSYKFVNSATIVTEDKPCNKLMKETAPKSGSNTSGSSGGGGSGSYYWSGGRVYGSGGSCLYGCGGTVTVGELKEA
ncbi:hypothetical protein [Pseudoxanthomonas sp. CF125]|jgi:uncharacterized membrane protein YgcG|uniref:hypothetical protein n=1 Tax=Pseudoxanthomonas sp. CF125 TaxID=1855303 RepID=UPI00088EF0E2|nr:hypothetical protein [Pseudoxanthomonas sp. CF125]SDQ57061.1 hypothetical protein SAMN05216569_1631 [Pseudoxanthomonas sp. CF125]